MSNYTKAPLIEVVFEIFHSEAGWDATVPGLLWASIRDEFPKKQQIPRQGVNFTIGPNGQVAQVVNTDLTRFVSVDESILVQISGGMLTVNKIGPYTGWTNFSPIIKKVLTAYNDILKIDSINRLGLRYINNIQNKENHNFENIKEVFVLAPNIPNGMPGEVVSMNNLTEFQVGTTGDRLAVHIGTLVPNATSNAPLLLEIAYITNNAKHLLFDDLDDWLKNAHEKATSVFEGVITEEFKQKLK